MKTQASMPFLLIVSVLAMAAAGLSAPVQAADAPRATARPSLSVSAERPRPLDWPRRLQASGSIVPWQEAIVGSESGGLKLVEVLAQVGDTVRSGQLLAVFANEGVQADVDQAQAQLALAQVQALEARGNADRARSMQDKGFFSEQQIQQLFSAEQAAQARVDAARAQLTAQQLRLRHTRVLAPDAGIISARTATVGAVTPAGSELFRLIRRSRLEWHAEVTSGELRQIKPGLSARISTADGQTVLGRVRRVAPTVHPQTRNALVYVDLNTDKGGARAGSFASGEFILGNSPALTLPQSALVMRDGFAWVFLLGKSEVGGHRVRLSKVQTGRQQDDRVEIIGTFEREAQVVGQGAGFLQDGDLVKLVSP